jgi:hypothetical protein
VNISTTKLNKLITSYSIVLLVSKSDSINFKSSVKFTSYFEIPKTLLFYCFLSLSSYGLTYVCALLLTAEFKTLLSLTSSDIGLKR